jgi:Uma2 family endonuclease
MTLQFNRLSVEELEELSVKLPLELADNDAFYDFCQLNEHLKFEQNPDGSVLVVPHSGGIQGMRNATLTAHVARFTFEHNGVGFDSSTAFKLPNGATRSPDAAWVTDERWDALTDKQQERFPPLAPDFVIELMSATDKQAAAKSKMREYIDNGVRLAWLIDLGLREVFIYRADGTISKHTDFEQPLTGEDVLPGFAFDLRLLQR